MYKGQGAPAISLSMYLPSKGFSPSLQPQRSLNEHMAQKQTARIKSQGKQTSASGWKAVTTNLPLINKVQSSYWCAWHEENFGWWQIFRSSMSQLPYFSHHKMHFPPTKQGGGKSVRLMERRKQIIFSCFLLLKNWCVLWKGASYGAKNIFLNFTNFRISSTPFLVLDPRRI